MADRKFILWFVTKSDAKSPVHIADQSTGIDDPDIRTACGRSIASLDSRGLRAVDLVSATAFRANPCPACRSLLLVVRKEIDAALKEKR